MPKQELGNWAKGSNPAVGHWVEIGEGSRMATTIEGVSSVQHWRNHTPGLCAKESDSGWALGVGVAGAVLMLPASGAHQSGNTTFSSCIRTSSKHLCVDSSGNASLSLGNHSICICLLIHATTMSWTVLCGPDTPWTRRSSLHTLYVSFSFIPLF